MARLPLETVRVLDGPADVTPRQTARGTTFIYCLSGELNDRISGHDEATFSVPIDASSTIAIICSWKVLVQSHDSPPADMKFSVLIPGGDGNQQDNFHAFITEYPGSPTAYYGTTINEVVTRDANIDLLITCNVVPVLSNVDFHCTVILGVDTGAGCIEYSNPA